jgi:hypothetical protein
VRVLLCTVSVSRSHRCNSHTGILKSDDDRYCRCPMKPMSLSKYVSVTRGFLSMSKLLVDSYILPGNWKGWRVGGGEVLVPLRPYLPNNGG